MLPCCWCRSPTLPEVPEFKSAESESRDVSAETSVPRVPIAARRGDALGLIAEDPSKATAVPPMESAVKWLSEMQPRARPRKRKGLIAYLNSRFGNKLTEPELQTIVD